MRVAGNAVISPADDDNFTKEKAEALVGNEFSIWKVEKAHLTDFGEVVVRIEADIDDEVVIELTRGLGD